MDDHHMRCLVIARILVSRSYFLKVVQSLLEDLRHPPPPRITPIDASVLSAEARWNQYRDSPNLEGADEMEWDQPVHALSGTTLSDLLAQQGGSKRKRSITHFHGIPLSILPPPTMYRRRPRESAPSPESMPSSPVEPLSSGSSGRESPAPKRPHTVPPAEGRVLRRSKRVDKLEQLLRKLDVARVTAEARRDEERLDTDMESESDDEDDVTILV